MGVKVLKKKIRGLFGRKLEQILRPAKQDAGKDGKGRKIAFKNASAVYVYVLASWQTECQLSVTTVDLGHWSMVTRKLQMFIE